eukprot:COSAG04_NODE_13511_length_602_cov_15.825050_2_plen_52_part_00
MTAVNPNMRDGSIEMPRFSRCEKRTLERSSQPAVWARPRLRLLPKPEPEGR